MKKLLIATMFGLTMITSAFASDATEVSNRARYSFKHDFRNVTNVSWSVKSGLSTAAFSDDGVFTEVFYDYDGTKIATCKAVALKELPPSSVNEINTKYSDYTVKEVISYDNDSQFYYFVSAENEKGKVVLKVENGNVSVFRKTSK